MLTNHDQDRIGSVVANNRNKIKLAATILLTLPGQPYLYYGEEIGMLGTKPDPYIREPFLWTDNKNDTGTTSWLHSEFSTKQNVIPLEIQKNEPESIFNHYKSLIALRKKEPALSQMLAPNLLEVHLNDENLLSYERPHAEKSVLIIHNLSSGVKIITLPQEKEHFNQVLFSSYFSPDQILPEFEMPACSSIILSQIFS